MRTYLRCLFDEFSNRPIVHNADVGVRATYVLEGNGSLFSIGPLASMLSGDTRHLLDLLLTFVTPVICNTREQIVSSFSSMLA
jgi:hypothetical protein